MPFIGKQPEVGAYSKLDAITTSATATYNLTLDSGAYYPTSANHLLVSLNGVMQAPQDSFTVSGSTIVFASTLASTDSIDFIMALGDVLDIGTPSDGTVTSSKLAGALTTPSTLAVGGNATVSGNMTVNTTAGQLDIEALGGGSVAVKSNGSLKISSGGGGATDLLHGTTEVLNTLSTGFSAPLGIHLGGTGTANRIDDYEEGSWTPVLHPAGSGTVYGTAAGTYTKVGNTVTCNWMIVLTTKGSLGNSVRIGGLPFTGLSAPSYQIGTFMSGNLDLDANERLTGMQYAGNQFIYLMIEQNDAALYQPNGSGFLNNDSSISGSITYMTSQ